MRLKFPRRFHKTLAFRLTFWYSAIFILSFLALSVISYLFVFSSIRDNRAAIKAELSEYVSLAERDGIEAIERANGQRQGGQPAHLVLVRLVDADNTTSIPEQSAAVGAVRPERARRIRYSKANGTITHPNETAICWRSHRRG